LIIQLEEAKTKLWELTEAVEELASAIKIDKLEAKIAELEEQTSSAGFWEMEGSGKILQDLKRAKDNSKSITTSNRKRKMLSCSLKWA